MYSLYLEEYYEENMPHEQIGKLQLYVEIFSTEFNYSFKKPVNDTCDACDSFQIKLHDASSTEEKQLLKQEYDRYLHQASKRYNLKKVDKERFL